MLEQMVRFRNLNEREQLTAMLYGHGYTYNQIADMVFAEPQTIKNRLSDIYRKLGYRGRGSKVKLALLVNELDNLYG